MQTTLVAGVVRGPSSVMWRSIRLEGGAGGGGLEEGHGKAQGCEHDQAGWVRGLSRVD